MCRCSTCRPAAWKITVAQFVIDLWCLGEQLLRPGYLSLVCYLDVVLALMTHERRYQILGTSRVKLCKILAI
jgi:hypothetical protein